MSTDSKVEPSPYRLETLGTLTLKGPVNAVNAGDQRQQRRRLALLAILAASDRLGRSRDQLLVLLWPESTEKKARHSLDQLLYAVRSSLGDAIFAGVNPLRLNASIISADVVEFEKHIDERNFSAAVDQYRGPFLEGFYLSDAKEFEDWIDAERRRLALRYTDALENLALEADQRHDYPEVIRWRQKLVDTDPISTRYAVAMASALAKAGDVAAAMAFADRYERTASRELGAGSIPDLRKVVREISPHSHINVVAPAPSLGTSTAASASPPIDPAVPVSIDPIVPVSIDPVIPGKASDAHGSSTRPRFISLSLLLLAASLVAGFAVRKYSPRASSKPVAHFLAPAASTAARNPTFNAARHDTHNIEAYELYVRGHDPVLLRNDSAAQLGLGYFIKATELDPNFAAGYAGLAEMYARQAMGSKPALPRNVLRERAEKAALKAISLDDSLAEGHAALGLVYSYWGHSSAAERELERAVALDPSAPHAFEYLAVTHATMGRTANALADARRAVAADPLSPTARATYAQMLYVVGRCGEAMPILDSMNLLQPPPLRVAITRSLCFDSQHRWAEAQAAVEKQAARGGVHAIAMIGLALGLSGKKNEALAMRSRIQTISGANPDYYDLAIVSYGLGDLDDAFANLDRSASTGSYFAELLGPVFDSLRRDPRFKSIIDPHVVPVASR